MTLRLQQFKTAKIAGLEFQTFRTTMSKIVTVDPTNRFLSTFSSLALKSTNFASKFSHSVNYSDQFIATFTIHFSNARVKIL
jgi:hypothetical protein